MASATEWAVHLDDVMVRRSGWHYYWRDAIQKAEQTAEWMAKLLGWSAGTQNEELQRYARLAYGPGSQRAETQMSKSK